MTTKTRFGCGCTYHPEPDLNGIAPWLAHCPLHEAAADMLALLREWAEFAGDDCQCFEDSAIADLNERCVPCRTSALLAKIDAR